MTLSSTSNHHLAETAQALLELTAQSLLGQPSHPEDGYVGDPFVDINTLLNDSEVLLAIRIGRQQEVRPLISEGLVILLGTEKHLAVRSTPKSEDYRVLSIHSATQEPNFSVIALAHALQDEQ